MNIVALYKTFRGEEFVRESVASVLGVVDKAYFVHDDTSWSGEKGNTVRNVVLGMDKQERMIHLLSDCGNQDQDYNIGVARIAEDYLDAGSTWVLLVDTDEVWGVSDLDRLAAAINTQMDVVYRAEMYEYIKSPFYQVFPTSPLKPVVLVRLDVAIKNGIGCRGSHLGGVVLKGVFFHHFCSVRKDMASVYEKHQRSCGIESDPVLPYDDFVHMWNALPNALDVLPLKNHRKNWAAVHEIEPTRLPSGMPQNPIVQAWMKYPKKKSWYKKVDDDYLRSRGLPAGFGPGHPEWSVPSKQNKYKLLILNT